MAYNLTQRLQSLGVATPMGRELQRQIDAGSYSRQRLINIGWEPDLAGYLATSLAAGTFKATKATEYGMIPAVAALIKGGGVVPNNYVLTQPTQMFDWAAVTKTFVANGSAVAGSSVPGGAYRGQTTAIKLSYHASTSYVQATGLNLDLTNLKNFLLPAYREPGTGPSTYRVFFSSDNFTTYVAFDLIINDIGWGLYAIPKEASSRTGAFFYSGPFTAFRIRERSNADYTWPQAAGDTYFGNPMRDVICRPKFMIGFDDSRSTLLSSTVNGKSCKSILDGYGFGSKGTLYALPRLHGQVAYATNADVMALYDAGWTIASHSWSHPVFNNRGLMALGPYGVTNGFDNSANHPTRQPTNDDTAIYDDIMQGVDAVIAMGIPEDHARHFALPQGGWDLSVMTAVKRAGLLSCRGISTLTEDYRRIPAGLSTGRNGDPRTLPPMITLPGSVQVDANSDFSARVRQAVDDAIATGGTGTSYCHQLHTDAIANLEALCAYLRQKSDEGLIDVVTLHEWQRGMVIA